LSSKSIIFPGSFDPITYGHMDLVRRAGHVFDKVIVAIAASTQKSVLFDLQERITLATEVLAHEEKVQVVGFEGLLIDFVHKVNASIILRGLRVASDFDFELQLATMNRQMAPNIETIFMTPGQQYALLSASLVREIAQLGGDVTNFVHPKVKEALYLKYGRK
jgi:pantetheine-phosphate adenylyltransferase